MGRHPGQPNQHRPARPALAGAVAHGPGQAVGLEIDPGNGLLLDLGSHVIDKKLRLPNGATSYVESSKVHHASARDLRAYGEKGCFSQTSDIQEKLIEAGLRPTDDPTAWGLGTA